MKGTIQMGKMKHLWAMAQILQDIEDINQAKLEEMEEKKNEGEVVYLKNRINGKVKENASWKQ